MLRRFSWQFGRGRPHRDRETECVLYSMPYLVPRNRVLSLLDALHALQYLVPRAAALAQPSDPYALSSSYTHATYTPCIQTRLGCTRESMPKCACTRIHAHTLMPLTLPVHTTYTTSLATSVNNLRPPRGCRSSLASPHSSLVSTKILP